MYLPPGQNYECVRCGQSCAQMWEIMVEPEKVEEIRSRPKEALAEARSPENPVVESDFTPGVMAMRQTPEGCCMQAANGLCALHAVFGLAAKPNVCRSFPYCFVETPKAIFVGVSFACTASLGNLGPAVADQGDALRDLHPITTNRRAIDEPPGLAVDVPLTWEQYFGVEADLDALLAPGDVPVPIEERLLAVALYVGMLARFLREGRLASGAMVAGPEANAPLIEHFRRRMREGDPPWGMLRSMATRRRTSYLLRRACLGLTHELRNVYSRRRSRARSYVDIFSAYFAATVGRGKIGLPTLKAPVAIERLERVAFDPSEPEMDELLTRYFRHRFFRKDLAVADDVQFGARMQMLYWGLVQWYAAAWALDDGREAVSLADLREALRAIEKYFALHSTFDRLFGKYPLLRGFLDRLFSRPLFVFSMARGGWSAPPSMPPVAHS